jgi:hypothetical protein
MAAGLLLGLAACAAETPSQRIAAGMPAEVAALRAGLGTVCTPNETDILLEGLALLADAARPEALSASQRAAIPRRDEAFRARYPEVSPECRARLTELAGPSPFGGTPFTL